MKRIAVFIAAVMMLPGCTNYKTIYNGIVREISGDSYNGRSVLEDGDIRTARYLIDRLAEINGVKPCPAAGAEDSTARPYLKSPVHPSGAGRWDRIEGKDKYLPWLQHFQFPMNVMRGAMSLAVDEVVYAPTFDFTVKEFSPSCHGFFKLCRLDEEAYRKEGFTEHLDSGLYRDQFVLIDWQKYLDAVQPDPFDKYSPYLTELENVGGIILKQESQFPYFKARSWYESKRPVIFVNGSFPDDAREIEVHIDAEMLPSRDAHNIVAWLPGTDDKSDRYYTLIAHYDHLGCMGSDFLFPGANDNASGVAMVLALTRYFSKHRPEHGIQIILLDAEEENLLGAFFYCANPRRPLDKIEYLINLDMVADSGDFLATEISENGEKGLERFRSINASGKFRPFDMALQEFSDNSDHFAFGQAGVPCIYFSTEGMLFEHYHTPRDCFENTSDSNFDRLFAMIVQFIEGQ